MPYKLLICATLLSLWLPRNISAQVLTVKSAERPSEKVDTLLLSTESNIAFLRPAGINPDTAKAMLRVRVLEKGTREAVQGATVLLHREQNKMLGRVTEHDGRCVFTSAPATYSLRVQMTGLKTLERNGIKLEAGKAYDLEVSMAKH
jgi:acyl-coenzyme A thioesterase PaaI-like protein